MLKTFTVYSALLAPLPTILPLALIALMPMSKLPMRIMMKLPISVYAKAQIKFLIANTFRLMEQNATDAMTIMLGWMGLVFPTPLVLLKNALNTNTILIRNNCIAVNVSMGTPSMETTLLAFSTPIIVPIFLEVMIAAKSPYSSHSPKPSNAMNTEVHLS